MPSELACSGRQVYTHLGEGKRKVVVCERIETRGEERNSRRAEVSAKAHRPRAPSAFFQPSLRREKKAGQEGRRVCIAHFTKALYKSCFSCCVKSGALFRASPTTRRSGSCSLQTNQPQPQPFSARVSISSFHAARERRSSCSAACCHPPLEQRVFNLLDEHVPKKSRTQLGSGGDVCFGIGRRAELTSAKSRS